MSSDAQDERSPDRLRSELERSRRRGEDLLRHGLETQAELERLRATRTWRAAQALGETTSLSGLLALPSKLLRALRPRTRDCRPAAERRGRALGRASGCFRHAPHGAGRDGVRGRRRRRARRARSDGGSRRGGSLRSGVYRTVAERLGDALSWRLQGHREDARPANADRLRRADGGRDRRRLLQPDGLRSGPFAPAARAPRLRHRAQHGADGLAARIDPAGPLHRNAFRRGRRSARGFEGRSRLGRQDRARPQRRGRGGPLSARGLRRTPGGAAGPIRRRARRARRVLGRQAVGRKGPAAVRRDGFPASQDVIGASASADAGRRPSATAGRSGHPPARTRTHDRDARRSRRHGGGFGGQRCLRAAVARRGQSDHVARSDEHGPGRSSSPKRARSARSSRIGATAAC